MNSLLSTLNKDELILIIETIHTKHKKEIEKIKLEHEYIIDTCKEIGIKFKNCSIEGCKALKIKCGSRRYQSKDIYCDGLGIGHCKTCNDYICDTYSKNCKCFQK